MTDGDEQPPGRTTDGGEPRPVDAAAASADKASTADTSTDADRAADTSAAETSADADRAALPQPVPSRPVQLTATSTLGGTSRPVTPSLW
ncbi:hypothetical protein ABZX66_30545, partial [Micromonospora aurantiaca]